MRSSTVLSVSSEARQTHDQVSRHLSADKSNANRISSLLTKINRRLSLVGRRRRRVLFADDNEHLPNGQEVIGQIEGKIHGEDEQFAEEIGGRQKINVVGWENKMYKPTDHTEKIRQRQEEKIDRTRAFSQCLPTENEK